jgi:hypothetical protein
MCVKEEGRSRTILDMALPPAVRLLALATAALVLAGCSAPRPSPNDPGIPEARAAAEARLDAMIARVEFSDAAIVLGSGRGDSCAYGTNGWIGTPPSNYRCWMRWVEVVVLPDAVTREEVAAALDAELAATDLPIPAGVVRALVITHPNNVGSAVGSGGHEGNVSISVSTEPFRAQFWPSPQVRVGGNVSESGDLERISAADIEATGATQIIVVSVSIEYWAEDGIQDFGEPYVPSAFLEERSSHGDNYYFDLAQAQPAAAVGVCLADPLVAPTSLTRQDEPFPRVTFKLYGVATSDDAKRVRDCLTTNLTSGTLAWYEPYYRGGTTPSPAPTPSPGVDPPK